MADFDNGFVDKTNLVGDELLIALDPNTGNGTNFTVQNVWDGKANNYVTGGQVFGTSLVLIREGLGNVIITGFPDGQVRNENTSTAEPTTWKFWSGTEAEYQALVTSDSVEDDVFYHRR